MSLTTPTPEPARRAREPQYAWNGGIVGMGASAGGAEALMDIVARLPPDGPPVLIVQHIPAAFVQGLTERLDRASQARVQIAVTGARLKAGQVYMAPADRHLTIVPVRGQAGAWCCRLDSRPPVNGFRPSVDVLFGSMVRLGDKGVGVILSGMGCDGAAGLLQMLQAGARTLGQDAASSVVYGMPKAAMQIGAVERQGPPARIAAQMLRLCCRKTPESA